MTIISLLNKTSATETRSHGDHQHEKQISTRWFADFAFNIAGYFKKLFAISSVALCLRGTTTFFGVFAVLIATFASPVAAAQWKCAPTPQDEIGPFYRPDSPVRDKIGTGYVLTGTVRSAATCKPIPRARIEFWQAGPDGNYGDAWRAMIVTDRRGRYRLETTPPPPYASRPPHIHILVDMRGYAGLITQHYPKAGSRSAVFDLVIETE